MRVPVVIAARNEEHMINRALGSLDQARFEPIVAVNGSTDNTAAIAESYGATVLDIKRPGKLPAQQLAIKSLGAKALEPVLFLDADSRPLLPRVWANMLINALDEDRPAASTGTFVFTDGNFVNDLVSTGRRWQYTKRDKATNATYLSGASMATRFHSPQTLERFLDMPHIWPGEDHALGRMIALEGGTVTQVLDPRAAVITSSRSTPTLQERVKRRAKSDNKAHLRHYLARAAQGSRPFRPNSELGY